MNKETDILIEEFKKIKKKFDVVSYQKAYREKNKEKQKLYMKEYNKNHVTTDMSNRQCIICDNSFTPVRYNDKCCSPECKKTNQNNLKRKSKLKLKEDKEKELQALSEEWKIPKMHIVNYNKDFLKENPYYIEALQLHTKLSGAYTFLTDEEISFRKEASRLSMIEGQKEWRRKNRKEIFKICKVCGCEFLLNERPSSFSKTCSNECSTELKRIQSNECSKRQREKSKAERKLVIKRMDINLICECCGNSYHPHKNSINRSKFCDNCKLTYGKKLYKNLEKCKLILELTKH